MKKYLLIIYTIAVVLICAIVFESKTKSVNSQVSVLNKNNTNLEQNIKNLTSQIKNLQSQNQSLQSEKGTLQKNLKDCAESLTGLVNIKDVDKDIDVELRYATENNFAKKKLYSVNICMIQKKTADKLVNANNIFLKSGYHIKVWDAYRPLSVQKEMWNIVKNDNYIADPSNGSGSVHNKGAAVDITLVDSNGKELEMPSGFDTFSKAAYRNNPSMSAKAKSNLNYLTNVMKQCGFNTLDTEWWHYEDTDSNSYPLLDVKLDYFQ